ncbi:MerR family transcriptional regulator [Nocardia carnea]|uniref:MerR family transcriptional regulator n=1 Tax=Nocardia carnea TaxID=37328 RepID=UPI002456AF74|nr:MerR family transcriptional regulator [Nocardia carnea]
MINGHMTIGQLSARTGVTVKALREYTDLGLVHTVGRSAAGYRLYTDDALWCVRFIGELRGLGLTIAEICQLTDTAADSSNSEAGAHLTELLERSRQRLHRRITDAQQILDRIDDFTSTHRARWVADDVCWTEDPCRCPTRA